MKRIICFLFMFLISSTILFSIEFNRDSKKIVGKIVLNKAKDLREIPNYDEKKLFKKAGYFTKGNLIGGELNWDGEIFNPLITEEPIDLTIMEKIYEALTFCNFEVFEKSSKKNKLPILDIDINIIFCKIAYPPNRSISCTLQSKIKIYLKSSDNKVLLEKTFYFHDYSGSYIFTYPNFVVSFFSKTLYNQLIIFFQSESFLGAYNGRQKIFKEYLLEHNFFTSVREQLKSLKYALGEVPESLPEDIECLYLAGNLIEDMSPLNNYKELFELNFSDSYISKISKLDNLTNLEYLILNNCQFLKNIDNLKTLKNLTYLNLENNYKRIKKYDSINSLKNLKFISLHKNGIEKIINLNNLNNLIKIDLSENNIEKIENLNNLNSIYKINLSNNIIRKLENLDALKNLESLDLNVNKIRKLENLANLSNLNELSLFYNKISKIENIENLSNLKVLYLGGNLIKKIENLNRLVDLEVLSLGGNKIKKIENLEDLVNLKKLYLGYNWQISKIENINNLLKLKVLNLSGTSIKEIENINNLINLEELYLSETIIKELKNIENLKKLKKLDISKTRINNLRVLENFPNLEILDITESKIKRLESLEKCPKLRRIKAEDIQIDEITKASYEFLKQRDWKFYENLTLEKWIKKYFIKIVE